MGSNNRVGRPVVTNCSSPLEKISKLINFYLLPVVKSQPTYLKDTRDTIRKVENIQLSQDNHLSQLRDLRVHISPARSSYQDILDTLANLLCKKKKKKKKKKRKERKKEKKKKKQTKTKTKTKNIILQLTHL